MELADLDKKYASYQDSVKSMNEEKATNQKIADRAKADALEVLATAKRFKDESLARNAKNDQREKDLADKIAVHEFNLAEFEKAKQAHEKAIAEAAAEHEEKVQGLAQERQSFEQRKKKFEDALKG
jgi:hypothetical protein